MRQVLALFVLALAFTATSTKFLHGFGHTIGKIAEIAQAIGYEVLDHPFGATHLHKETDDGTHSIVEFPKGGLFSDLKHLEDLYASWLKNQNNKEQRAADLKDAELQCSNQGGPDFFKFFPTKVGILTPDNASVKYSAPCFQENEVALQIIDDKTVQVTHTASKATDLKCTDAYFYSTLSNFHIETKFKHGKNVITFKVTPEELETIKRSGIMVFRMCDKTVNFIPDLFKTLTLFLGGLGLNPNIPFFGSKPTDAQIRANIKFIYEATGFQWQERPKNVVVELDESLLSSGDFIAITRFDGLDQIIEWGTGSHVGHCVMILKVDGVAYVVESQAAWYWPRKDIQMNPYKEWVKWANDAGFQATWLPLRKEFAAKFDADAAYKAFKQLEGTPYGYHNFLFGYIDTPDHSFPSLLDPNFLVAAFALVEHIDPFAAQQVFGDALNMRLGTKNLTIAQLAIEANKRGLTLPELYATPEQDGWVYIDGVSYVCSSFVVAMYKAGGLFGDMPVNAVEFTPRDLYELEFLDPNPVVPDNCKAVDPTNKFCQIMGGWRMEFPGIGSLKPYPNMNEHCYSEGPEYKRFPVNC